MFGLIKSIVGMSPEKIETKQWMTYLQSLIKVQELAGAVETQVSNSWENTKQFLGFSDNTNTDTQKSNDVQIDNTNKNHTIVDVNIKSDAGVVTEQNAQSTGGRVKLNTASNGV
jgi:hypothetical protein